MKPSMLASSPASMVNHIHIDLGIIDSHKSHPALDARNAYLWRNSQRMAMVMRAG
jgi:hypothetical protein